MDAVDGPNTTNCKNLLNEMMAAIHSSSIQKPVYFHWNDGEEHAKRFHCLCHLQIDEESFTAIGEGNRKVDAEKNAAEVMLQNPMIGSIIQSIQLKIYPIRDPALFSIHSLLLFSSMSSSSNDENESIITSFEQAKQKMIVSRRQRNYSMSFPWQLWSMYGDAILRLVVTEYLFHTYFFPMPTVMMMMATEEEMNQLLSMVLQEKNRVKLSVKLGLFEDNTTTVATAAESFDVMMGLFATTTRAICERVLLNLWKPMIDLIVVEFIMQKQNETERRRRRNDDPPIANATVATVATNRNNNYKSKLCEYAQRMVPIRLPEYTILARNGPDHAPEFTVRCRFQGYTTYSIGKRSKKEAEQHASEIMMLTYIASDLSLSSSSSSSSSSSISPCNHVVASRDYRPPHQQQQQQQQQDIKKFTREELFRLKLTLYLGSDYYFERLDWLQQAFTCYDYHSHNSSSSSAAARWMMMIFLGNLVLRKCILSMIIRYDHIHYDANDLLRKSEYLHSVSLQAHLAEELQLADYIVYSPSTSYSNNNNNNTHMRKLLSNVFQAMVAALFLDAKNKNTSTTSAASSPSSIVHHLVDPERRRRPQHNQKLMKLEQVITIWFQIPFERCFGGGDDQ